ncbi:MAG: hypothetical protein H6545_09435 [Bacteroidales bacterium]|nr:hypothetical protein [Bacteroidales bacterium]HOO66672.1 hypothetical protein [Bacteroidales bacterium]HPE22886.1 hypothetical protein [Bacteroidales bacterium]HPJ05443.1 hypothetical protein [Bacteroidales bacterium]HPQ64326.1 hypothetical protein [Bacteroidales bacterium]
MERAYFILSSVKVILLSIVLHLANPYTRDVSAQEDSEIHRFFFIPGGAYHGKYSPNAFTRTYCESMNDLLGEDFLVIDGAVSKSAINNVAWALSRGQKPMRKPEKKKKTVIAFKSIMEALHDETSDINIVSSSFGTALTAQVGIMLTDFFITAGKEMPDINLVMGSSMISKDSKLYFKLEELRREGMLTTLIYDELQDPGDNVTGMCGKSRVGAFARGLRMSIVIFHKYKGQPSILNNNPQTGHLHLQRAQSEEKAEKFLEVTLVDYALAGEEIRAKAIEMLKN